MRWNRKNDFPLLLLFLNYICSSLSDINIHAWLLFIEIHLFVFRSIKIHLFVFRFILMTLWQRHVLRKWNLKATDLIHNFYSIVKLNISNHSRHIYTREILVSYLDESRIHHFQFGPTKVRILQWWDSPKLKQMSSGLIKINCYKYSWVTKYIIYYSSSMSEVIGLLLTYPNIIHVVRLIF